MVIEKRKEVSNPEKRLSQVMRECREKGPEDTTRQLALGPKAEEAYIKAKEGREEILVLKFIYTGGRRRCGGL